MCRLFILLMLLFILGCTHKEIIKRSNISAIDVVLITLPTTDTTDTLHKQIVGDDAIMKVIRKLNSAVREPIKFYPTHRIIIKYQSGEEKLVLCRGSSMKVDGLTYKLSGSISTILGN